MDFIRLARAPRCIRHALLAVTLSLGASLPAAAGPTEPELQAPALVAPSLGCGASPATAALFIQAALPHADRRSRQAAPPRPGARQAAPRPQRRHHAEPQRRRHAESPPAQPAEAQPSLSQAYFTCSTSPLVAMPVGGGWMAVGPLRKS